MSNKEEIVIKTVEFNQVSLLERIKNAESNEELLKLIDEGNEYKFASDKTRRRWEKAAARRTLDLEPKPEKKSKKKRKN